MFRSPLGRKLSRGARRAILVTGLFAVVAGLPYVNAGAWQQEEEARPRAKSQASAKGQANIIEGAEFVPGDVLVRFRTDTAAKTAESVSMPLRADDGGEVKFERFKGSDMVRGLRLAKVDPARTLEAVKELANRSDVLYAEPNYIWRAKQSVPPPPNDPRYTSGEMYAMARINAPDAWKGGYTGSKNVVVGVLDGGVDVNHPDLKDNIWVNPAEVAGNNFDDDQNGYADDVNGFDFHHNDKTVFDNEEGDDHATHVAGTIGAKGNNGIGVTGVNWNVSIVSLKVLGPEGGSVSNIIEGYTYARRLREAGVNLRVLNNSYGGPGKSLAALDAITQLNAAGILFVVAAGNDARDNFNYPDFPASYNVPNVIAVASTNTSDGISSFSNFGARVVSMGAPGSSILSTTPGNTYSFFGGTSMAAPHVAGAGALIVAARPDIPLSRLRGVLAYTGDRLPSLAEKTTTGRRLNVAKAVESALENDATAPAPPGNFRVTGQSGRSITLAWTAPGDDGHAGVAADYDFFFTNPTTQTTLLLPSTTVPATPGTEQTVTVNVPFRNFSGTLLLRVYDNAGNTSAASLNVTIPVNTGSDPYTVALSDAQPLAGSTTGANLFPVGGDDKYAGYSLPFAFPFYGATHTNLTVSTNGALYFSVPPRRENGDADDVPSSVEAMQGQRMIAGLWDDIRTNRCTSESDPNTCTTIGNVYVTQPDANRVIFRWQGETFLKPVAVVNFEIELRRDGTIQMRYGDNPRVFPVVGISGGEPDAYVIPSHTREYVSPNQPISLSNAQTVTFSPRPVPVYSISGSVRDANGAGVPNVTVFLSGLRSAVTMTNASGSYSFTGLVEGGNYTVTPSLPNATFAPPTQTLNNLSSDRTADFTATLCSFSITPNAQSFGAEGGTGSVSVTTGGGCTWMASSNVSWITFNGGSAGSGSGTLSFSVMSNPTTASRTGTINVAGQTFTVTQAGIACAYSISPTNQSFGAGAATGSIAVLASSTVGCNWSVWSNVPWISITSGMGHSGSATVNFTVEANPGSASRTGTITVAGLTFAVFQAGTGSTAETFQFSASTYQVGEGEGRATLLVTRGGDLSTSMSINYSTVDDPASVPCATANGTAYARCDYSTSVDTLSFAPGEGVKSLTIPIIDDAHVEGNETFTVRLLSFTGAILGTPATATLTIQDNDAAGQPNPIYSTPFFVRQHYLDFLSREPDEQGFEAWKGVLNGCSDVNNNPLCDRITVSQAFFGSPEFRLKGFFVYNFYSVALNRRPSYEEIILDMRRVTGSTEQEVYQKRAAFPTSFTERADFKARFDALDNTAFVNALLDRYALQQITTPDPANPEGGARVTLTRADLVARLGASGAQSLTRAQVLRAVVESNEVGTQEFNRAFVAMQYYGYLRRAPEEDGYQAWLRVINQDPNNVRIMVNGFMNSTEYKLRFGQP
ncbi:MAG TPA: S8 family serine peptidase [Pyrinomonadaceae bacterium]|nr:S8 family serine peptidase [Pyrinomonadaceae bacterium]